MGLWNAEGLTRHMDDENIKYFIKSFDICGVNETWSEDHDDFLRLVNSHDVFSNLGKRRSRFGRASGGVAVFVKKKHVKFIKQIYHDFEYGIILLLNKGHFGLHRDIIYIYMCLSPPSIIYCI